MGFFGMLFWLLVLWFVIRTWRRSQRCVAIPSGYARRDLARQGEHEDYIDALESRVTELEERLDFTERLLASKSER